MDQQGLVAVEDGIPSEFAAPAGAASGYDAPTDGRQTESSTGERLRPPQPCHIRPASAPSPLARRREIERAALGLFSAASTGAVTLRQLTSGCMVSPNTIYGWYGGIGGLYRASLLFELREIRGRVEAISLQPASPRETVLSFARWVVGLFCEPTHRDVVAIALRDRGRAPWLTEAYQANVLKPLEDKLAAEIRAAGRAMDLSLETRGEAERRLIDQLFVELLVGPLSPRLVSDSPNRPEVLVQEAVRDVVLSIRQADADATALAALLDAG